MNKERKNVSLAYLKAREIFREYADQDPVLQGNDNILGRIGEAIAHSFLEHLGRKPIVNINQTNPGYDITCQDNGEQVSVKMITNENKSGSTSKIRKSFNIKGFIFYLSLVFQTNLCLFLVFSRSNFRHYKNYS